MEIDRIDRHLLDLLQRDGRITNAALAEQVHLSESACLRRVRALEQSGLIAGYGAQKTAEHLAKKSVGELVRLISSGGVPQPVMKNAIQLLAETKRDALTRALMAIAVNRGNARYNEPNHQEQP